MDNNTESEENSIDTSDDFFSNLLYSGGKIIWKEILSKIEQSYSIDYPFTTSSAMYHHHHKKSINSSEDIHQPMSSRKTFDTYENRVKQLKGTKRSRFDTLISKQAGTDNRESKSFFEKCQSEGSV